MRKYIKEKLKEMENTNNIELYLPIIQFIQHERLIHLIITIMTFVVFVIFAFIFLIFNNIITTIMFIGITILLICYIEYYCFMENSVQKMYKLYSERKVR